METLEKSTMCRLCGKNSGISIDIFDKNESHVQKINAILPILVHEMDLLPKQMCHRCSYKLEEFYNFYAECAKTDTELKSQLSWMRKENLEEKIVTPMVKMNRFKIKTEPPDNDSIHSNNVLGQINENSLVFPASILQHSYDFDTSPMLTCSRCRCICNGSININKQSPKEVQEPLKDKVGKQPHSSNAAFDVSNKSKKLNEPKSVNKRFDFNKDLIEDDSFREKNVEEILNNNFINGNCNKPEKVNGMKVSQNEKLNRALRPRKGSVDYMGQKKIATNIKSKLKSKLDMLDPSVVKSAIIKTNIIQSGPIVKLQKVDDAMKTLRAQKNLEEFNRRIKEFQQNSNQRSKNSYSTKHFLKDNLFAHKKSYKEEDQIKKQLHKEKKRRKSLHKQGSQQNNIFINSVDLKSKPFQQDESMNKNISQNNENPITISLNKDKIQNKNNLQDKETDTHSIMLTDENTTRVRELPIKQETLKKIIVINNEQSRSEVIQEEPCQVGASKQSTEKLEERIPLNAVVKLEKDYTCNVDYPRIKIKRQITVTNASTPEKGILDINLIEKNKTFSLPMKAKSISVDSGNVSPKHLRSDDRKLRVFREKNKIGKIKKIKIKRLDTVKVKRKEMKKNTSLDNNRSEITIIKYYCEECDTCFRNKELFKLHPCYQK